MSTRCQIEFRTGGVRRTVYRHWDGYPSAVIPDLLAFLAWSTRSGDAEYESANFLYWSKRGLDERSVQLGFGICANDELHGDVEYYYVVEHLDAAVFLCAFIVAHEGGTSKVGQCVQQVAVPRPLFSSSSSPAPMELPTVMMTASGTTATTGSKSTDAAITRTTGLLSHRVRS